MGLEIAMPSDLFTEVLLGKKKHHFTSESIQVNNHILINEHNLLNDEYTGRNLLIKVTYIDRVPVTDVLFNFFSFEVISGNNI